jgi:hypothetical protein
MIWSRCSLLNFDGLPPGLMPGSESNTSVFEVVQDLGALAFLDGP